MLYFPEEEKKAFVEVVKDMLSSAPVHSRIEALGEIYEALSNHLYPDYEVDFTKAHRETFEALMELWLSGKDPYSYYFPPGAAVEKWKASGDVYDCVPEHLVVLSTSDREALRDLFGKTEVESFLVEYGIYSGAWKSKCELIIDSWEGRIDFSFHPYSCEGYPDTERDLWTLNRIHEQLDTPLSKEIVDCYLKLVAYDLVHRGVGCESRDYERRR